jgi:hypothetical protein
MKDRVVSRNFLSNDGRVNVRNVIFIVLNDDTDENDDDVNYW